MATTQERQERLVELMRQDAEAWGGFHCGRIAAAILGSDVIRELQAEAWDRCAGEYGHGNAFIEPVVLANPYREESHEQKP